ncbi:aminoglycoside phosphotransferase family protein [Actinomyces viscosus]|uniref:Phosphotransferase enzyme family n=1 Tax=Actinomyces viscosus TaxID=1656 RepID=A0A448PI38_ACTVI|nr:aminoglycoside phosphotransferase family protein [Actinomyces viscosus]TFH53481.1 aminoglycoside phosphotransferase family protein [Actinomyces viscosus]VEI14570.1 Phosphotransferase enzyme family [Actinomyces viscosus]
MSRSTITTGRTTATADAVSTVLDADRLSELVDRPVRAGRLRIKPDVSILVSLVERSTGVTAGWARLLWPVSRSKASRAERLAARLGIEPPPVTRAVDGGLLLQSGPLQSDPKLAEPMALAARQGALGAWEVGDLLRYNPSRRLVLRVDGAVLRLRAHAGGPADDVHRALSALLPVPRLLGSEAVARCEGHVSLQQWCGDTNLAEIPGEAADDATLEATRRVGALLAELHSCTGLLEPELVDRLPRQHPDPRDLAEVHARQLDVLAPELAHRVRKVGAMLPARLSGDPVLTHGDASPDQVLYEYSTGRIWLTDFDRVRLAPAVTDLGSYLAVAPPSLRCALLQGYGERRPVPDTEQLGTAIALSRLARLADPLRQADPSWRERVSTELAAIKRIAKAPQEETSWT